MSKYTLLLIFLSVSLLARYHIYLQNRPVLKVGDKVKITHTFLDEPKKTLKFQSFWVDDVCLVIPSFPEYHYGNKVTITGSISINNNSYLIKKKQILTIKNPKIEPAAENKNFLLSFSYFIRQKITDTFNRYLSQDESALLVGIILGGRQGLSDNFYEDLKASGLLHVVAASGMNVSMVGAFIYGLSILVLHRKTAIIATLLGISFYAILSGLNPPIIRASIMGVILMISQLFGRQNLSLFSLFLTGYLMLMIEPDLIFDVGFELSFLATIGILLIKPPIDRATNLFRFPMVIKQDFGTTMAAQISTIPIILSSFSTYSIHSIILNILILWLIPFLMLFGGLASILSLIHPILASPLLYLSYPLLTYFKFIVVNLTRIIPPLEMSNIPWPLIVSYYLILLGILLSIAKKQA